MIDKRSAVKQSRTLCATAREEDRKSFGGGPGALDSLGVVAGNAGSPGRLTVPVVYEAPSGAGTVKTGQGERRTTFSATEPKTNLRQPVQPWVAVTIMSTFSDPARSMI